MSTPRPLQILVVEDEAAIADNLLYVLKAEGFGVEWLSLGAEAVARIREANVDLVILDVGLPDMSGFEVCKSIRRFSQVPILFLTARAEEVDRVVGLEIGGDDYVAKPFSPREVAARVKAILKRARNTPADDPRIPRARNAFVCDEPRACIHYHGRRLELTRYEYLILKTLLRHPERVYTREQLMRQAWDSPETSLERAVDTHIKSLRAKLREVHDTDPIRTHRGMGYSIVNEPLED
ncbi:MAG TPA: two-component system response regulator CreB [Gammaproteobacteria bacterium]|nr:two-component system response regulator CreB [Gammaproteobacteria bacterium]